MRFVDIERPLVIAHRGAKNLYPENTISSIKAALALGVDGVEFDVDRTSDGQAVVIHQESMLPDTRFRRLELVPTDSARDWVGGRKAEELASLDCGAWFAKQFAGEKIPRLSELEALDWSAAAIFLELKDPTYFSSKPDSARAEAIVQACAPFLRKMFERGVAVNAISFNPRVLTILKERVSGIKRLLAVAKGSGPSTGDADGLVLSLASYCENPPSGGEAREIYLYESSSRNRKESTKPGEAPEALVKRWEKAIESRVYGLITDYPDQLLTYLQKRAG